MISDNIIANCIERSKVVAPEFEDALTLRYFYLRNWKYTAWECTSPPLLWFWLLDFEWHFCLHDGKQLFHVSILLDKHFPLMRHKYGIPGVKLCQENMGGWPCVIIDIFYMRVHHESMLYFLMDVFSIKETGIFC